MANTTVATTTASIPPNQSLYLQNLPEKLQKNDLRRELYILFSTYGPVLDVTAMKGAKSRGSAHVLMRDVQSATQALRACQGFELSGKEMRISYSKNRSHTLSKLTGTFVPPTSEPAQAAGGAPAATGGFAIPGTAPAAAKAPEVAGEKAQAAAAGTKRPRDESEDEQEAEMEVEDEDEGAMEMSDEDDD